MNIKVGNAPVSWGVMEVADWGEQVAYGKVLDEIAEAGYAGTELGPFGYFPTQPDKLASELSDRGLQLVASFVPIPLAHPERHEAGYREAMNVAQLLTQTGAPLIVFADEMSEARMAVSGRADEAHDGRSGLQSDDPAAVLQRLSEGCSDPRLS